MIEAIHSLAINFLAGKLDPSWTHAVLLGGSILGEVAVALGIILESSWPENLRQWIGIALVIGGVVIGAAFTISLFVFDEAISEKQQADMGEMYGVLQTANRTLAAQGVQLVQQQEQTKGTLDKLGQIEKRMSRLEETAARPAAPPALPPTVPQTGSPYTLTDDAKRIIRDTTMPGAVVSIIPFMPNLEQFAVALGNTFAAVPGAQVAVGRGNFIMNGQTGLIVQYDHSNPVSASVFAALRQAGLNPIDGPNTPGPVVFIKVATP